MSSGPTSGHEASAASGSSAENMLKASKALLRSVVPPPTSSSAAAVKFPSVRLSSGALMPQIGLGTYELREDKCVSAVREALKLGCRAIDTAGGYRNEALVAQGIAESGVPREEIFITSKLPPTKQGAGAYDECLATLERLRTSYIDLYLLHWPGVAGKKLDDPTIKETRKESWLALERLHKEGKCRSIGVSNFLPLHLDDLCSYASVLPAVNQFEFHPLLKQLDAVEASVKRGIAVEAYSSLARGNDKLLKSAVVERIAAFHTHSSSSSSSKPVTASQVCLAWAMARGVIVIPKSASPERIAENLAACELVGELTEAELAELDALEGEGGEGEGGTSLRTCWNPHTILV